MDRKLNVGRGKNQIFRYGLLSSGYDTIVIMWWVFRSEKDYFEVIMALSLPATTPYQDTEILQVRKYMVKRRNLAFMNYLFFELYSNSSRIRKSVLRIFRERSAAKLNIN